jgi:hypothetical protein
LAGDVDPEVSGERHDERALGAGLHVHDHHGVGALPLFALLAPEGLLLALVLHERARVRSDHQVVRAVRGRVGGRHLDLRDLAELLIDHEVHRDDRKDHEHGRDDEGDAVARAEDANRRPGEDHGAAIVVKGVVRALSGDPARGVTYPPRRALRSGA